MSALKAKLFKSVLSLSLRSDAGGLLSLPLFFLLFFSLTLSSSDRQAGIIILIQHRYVRLGLVMLSIERKELANRTPKKKKMCINPDFV